MALSLQYLGNLHLLAKNGLKVSISIYSITYWGYLSAYLLSLLVWYMGERISLTDTIKFIEGNLSLLIFWPPKKYCGSIWSWRVQIKIHNTLWSIFKQHNLISKTYLLYSLCLPPEIRWNATRQECGRLGCFCYPAFSNKTTSW